MAYANSADPDQTALEGDFWSGSTLYVFLANILWKNNLGKKNGIKSIQNFRTFTYMIKSLISLCNYVGWSVLLFTFICDMSSFLVWWCLELCCSDMIYFVLSASSLRKLEQWLIWLYHWILETVWWKSYQGQSWRSYTVILWYQVSFVQTWAYM